MPVSSTSAGCGIVSCQPTVVVAPGTKATVGICTPGSLLAAPPHDVSATVLAAANAVSFTPGETSWPVRGAGVVRMPWAWILVNKESITRKFTPMPQ